MRFPTPAPMAYVVLSLIVALQASARVGETQEEFEKRLLQPSIGKFIPREKNPDPAREEEALRQQPFNDFRSHFPDGVKERKYWKSAVPNVLSNENGWRVHVFFQNNHSVMEAYCRVGDSLSDFEVQNILRANQGTSTWIKTDPDSPEAHASALGCDYRLADGTLQAHVVGNWLMVYSTQLDVYVKNQLRIQEEARASQQQEHREEQKVNAPASTAGF